MHWQRIEIAIIMHQIWVGVRSMRFANSQIVLYHIHFSSISSIPNTSLLALAGPTCTSVGAKDLSLDHELVCTSHSISSLIAGI